MRNVRQNPLAWLSLVLLALLATIGHVAAAEPGQQPPSSVPIMGQLKIDGQAVERLTLLKCSGVLFDFANPIVLQRPPSMVSLPAGKYVLRQIDLNGGYHCNPGPIFDAPNGKPLRETDWLLTISPDKPCSIKIDTPLKQQLRASRQGQTIYLAYQLLDSNGRRYAREKRGTPPRFTVYCNGREVDSGSFEYG
jgi:hypothetical protein